jgi:hypothetical protein
MLFHFGVEKYVWAILSEHGQFGNTRLYVQQQPTFTYWRRQDSMKRYFLYVTFFLSVTVAAQNVAHPKVGGVKVTKLSEAPLPVCPTGNDSVWDNCVGSSDYTNSGKYTGQYKSGKPDGKGAVVWADGDKYEGDFKSGAREGLGTFTRSEGRGSIYGVWRNGRLTESLQVGTMPNPNKVTPVSASSAQGAVTSTNLGFPEFPALK